MAMTWTTGPCALVLARRSVPLDRLPLSDVRPLLAPIVTVLVAVLLAAGPLVRRIRLLTQQVRRYAESHYAEEITVGGRDEIGALARAFTEAGAEIRKRTEAQEARERTLRAFLENTTHDVMIPLTVLQGHLTTLREQAAANTAPDAATISAAMGEAHYLGALMHNLAVAAKLEASEPVIQRTPVDLNALVSRVAGRHAPLARQKGVALERALEEKPLLALADVTLAEQAVSNVVFNAVRYNHEGGHVAVILERAKSGDRFLIKVIDDGPGIPPEEMSRLVERHFRGNEARSRDPNGHGLGLNIAWRATEMHGWVLRLSASEFGGLQVEIEGQAMPVVESER
jgi:signal transduction histidine kinase